MTMKQIEHARSLTDEQIEWKIQDSHNRAIRFESRGIAARIDRQTGDLLDCFVPRFAA